MSDNPFLSIIIPTYNPQEYLPNLLESITHNDCIDKIEVVISDDCSTEPFDDILAKFPGIHFNVISNEKHAGFPRNGRQHGAEEAHGTWICFSDQDDYFLDHGFDLLFEFIRQNNPKNYIMTDFIEESAETGKKILRERHGGWTHGKFYEREFWNKFRLKYDLVQYCEDINLSTKIDCIVTAEHIQPAEIAKPIYVWRRRKDSLSDIDYFKKSMPDYIKSTLGVIVVYVNKYFNDPNIIGIINLKFIVALLHVYFYYQSKQLNDSRQGLIRSLAVLQPIYSMFKKITGFSNDDIVDFVNNDIMAIYNKTRAEDCQQIPFVEQITFKDWLNLYLD